MDTAMQCISKMGHHVEEVAPVEAMGLQVAVIRVAHHRAGVLVVAVRYEQQRLALQFRCTLPLLNIKL